MSRMITYRIGIGLLCSAAAVGTTGCLQPSGRATASSEFGSSADVSASDANRMLSSDSDIRYLDVRTVAEFEDSHPAGAFNVPYLIVDAQGNRSVNPDFMRVVEANFSKDSKLIVGCKSGGRSKMAQGALNKAGFTNVVNMLGGFGGKQSEDGRVEHQGWSQIGLPTDNGAGGERSYAALNSKSAQQ